MSSSSRNTGTKEILKKHSSVKFITIEISPGGPSLKFEEKKMLNFSNSQKE